jgi:hypothetical protein
VTDGGPDLAAYERTRQQIIDKYRELEAVKADLATKETRFRQVCQTLPAEYRPVDDGILSRLSEQLSRAEQVIEGLIADLGFPFAAYDDSRKWTDVNGAATRASNEIFKIARHGSDVSTWRDGVSQNLTAGRMYPNAAKPGPRFPWIGAAGDNYRSQIPNQQAAADRLALMAIRTAGAVSSIAVNVVFLYLALLLLIVALIVAIKLIGAAMAALTGVVAWLLSTGIGIALAFAVVAGLRLFWRNAAQLLWKSIQALFAAVASFIATEVGARMAVSQQTLLMRNMLAEEQAGTPYQTPAFSPDARWPNPTRDEEFPHMAKVGDQWKVVTLDVYEK